MFVIHKHQVCGVFVVAAKWTITTSNADSPKRSYMETLQLIVSAKTFFPNKITVTSSGIKTWACICVCAHLCPTLCDPMDCNPPGSSVHGILQGRILGWVAIPFSRVIFPTQGSNMSLLHCRQILYRLSHQGSPSNIMAPSQFSWFPREAEHRGHSIMCPGKCPEPCRGVGMDSHL